MGFLKFLQDFGNFLQEKFDKNRAKIGKFCQLSLNSGKISNWVRRRVQSTLAVRWVEL